ncbi:MAG: hypothetical protein Q9P44_04010 [Anaerolineae bacterium]|nr:hypothetical protein [Anaerolineae bacterium]
MRYRAIIGLNAFFLCLIFAIVFTAQVLGFLGIYWRWFAVPITFIVMGASLTGYYRLHKNWFETLNPDDDSDQSLFTLIIVGLVLLLLTVVFGLRMIAFPYSELGRLIPSDFYAYHALKALDLVRSHSYWNVTIPYGEYPLGYESLLAFSQALTGSLQWAGLLQFVLVLWLLTTLVLLLRRYAKLPLALSFLLSAAFLFVPLLYGQLLTIGKNDVLLSITVLTAILHSSAASDERFHPMGLAYATLISIATKTGGLFVLVYLWGLILWRWWQAYQKKQHYDYLHPAIFAAALGLMFPGGLWVIRNLIRMGAVLSPEISSFTETTIATNLNNALLYQSGTESIALMIAAAYVVALTIFLWLNQRFRWRVALLLVMITLSFMTTPLSAFHTPQSTVLRVEWRYVLHGALWGYVVLIGLGATLIVSIWREMTDSFNHKAMVVLVLIIGIGGVLWIFDVPTQINTDEATYRQALIDPYPESDAEYDSIYDYVRQEISMGTIFIESLEPFFLMYPNADITVTQGTLYPLGLSGRFDVPTPDYAMTTASHTLTFDKLPNDYQWEVIYEDSTGRIFRRVP